MTVQWLDGAEVHVFPNAMEWESWLADHHQLSSGVWLKIAKKGAGVQSLTLPEALDVALCFGWIDSQRRSLDDKYFLQRYSRRRPKGSWSRVNVDKVERLMAAGRMAPPGLAEVAAAKADGRWDAAYESQRNVTVPPDLESALQCNPDAGAAFAALGKTDRYLLILPLLKARSPETRAKRIEEAIAMLRTPKAGPVA